MRYGQLVQRAVSRGLEFVLAQQAEDGFWREYELKPGAAEAWTTAWIGWLVARHRSGVCRIHLRRACEAVLAARTPDGWGYNRATGPDADSTAWALRFLSQQGLVSRSCGSAERLLHRFIDLAGRSHTFAEPDVGEWSRSHADVTPTVGLALVETGGDAALIRRVRRAVLSDQQMDGGWRSYWWQGDSYATARSLEFLAATDAIEGQVRRSALAWLASHGTRGTLLECAWTIEIALQLYNVEAPCLPELLARLLSSQADDGSWPASSNLLVPPQRSAEESHPPGPFEDSNRCVSTANIVGALAQWLARAESRPASFLMR